MSTLRTRLMEKTATKIFPDLEERESFIRALTQTKSGLQAAVWTKAKPQGIALPILEPLSWQPSCVDRLEPGAQLGRSELHDSGYFYIMDMSSVFSCAPLQMVDCVAPIVFDMCSAPGGKAILSCGLLSPRMLICNEVIRKRTRQLVSNLKRCEIPNTAVTSGDPRTFADIIGDECDVVIVDAPCSGQALLAKGKKADGCFHPLIIRQNAKRQRRVLASSATLVRNGGYVLYSTCTFSMEENEQVVDWFLETHPNFAPITVPALETFRSHLTELPCYRLFPQQNFGAGAFTVMFRKTGELNEKGERELRLRDLLSHHAIYVSGRLVGAAAIQT